jgi:hypothetical protein
MGDQQEDLNTLIQELRRLTIIQENNNKTIVARQAVIIRRIEDLGRQLNTEKEERTSRAVGVPPIPIVGDRVSLLRSGGIGRTGDVGTVTRVTNQRTSVRLDSSGRIAVRAHRNVVIIAPFQEDDGN